MEGNENEEQRKEKEGLSGREIRKGRVEGKSSDLWDDAPHINIDPDFLLCADVRSDYRVPGLCAGFFLPWPGCEVGGTQVV